MKKIVIVLLVCIVLASLLAGFSDGSDWLAL